QLFLWMIAGWLAGYAFGIKYTGVFAIFALVVFQTFRFVGVVAALGMMLIMIGSLFGIGVHKFAYIDLDGVSSLNYALASIIPGLGLLGFAILRKRISVRPFLVPMVLFGSFALLA